MKKKLNKYLPKLIGAKINTTHLIRQSKATQQAFDLFCSPRRGSVKPEQAPFLDAAKAEKQAFTFDLQTYHWPGKRETVLLVHGWESNSHRWKNLIEQLQQQDYNVYAFDAPGHGYSNGTYIHIPLYSKCVDHMLQKTQASYIVGHSIGAMTTVFNQHREPAKLADKLVLLGPPSELTAIMQNYQHLLNLKPRVMRDLENKFENEFGFRFSEFSIARFAKNLSQKGLIVHDKYDKIAPVQASKAIHHNWPASELMLTEGAGHSLNNDAIHEKIVQFLNA